MPRRQKHVLIVIFLTPSGAIVFAVLRLTIQEGIKDGPTIDPVRLILYSTLEVSLCMYYRFSLWENVISRFHVWACDTD